MEYSFLKEPGLLEDLLKKDSSAVLFISVKKWTEAFFLCNLWTTLFLPRLNPTRWRLSIQKLGFEVRKDGARYEILAPAFKNQSSYQRS